MKRLFGSTGIEVAAVGQGSWRSDQSAPAAAVAALRRGIDLGMTHIDTAEMYGNGAAEKVVGTAIHGRRDDVFLVSKVLPGHASRQGTIEACERSLRCLNTDHLDCYLLHWRGSHPLDETVSAFDDLIRSGKIRAWGVSNFDVDDLEEIHRIAGPGHPACNQVLYHVQQRAIEHAVLPWCTAHDTAIVAYTPFGETPGLFDSTARPGSVLREIADAHGATPRQVALAFLLRNPQLFVIPKAASPAHVTENAGAARLALTPAQLDAIDAAFPRGKRRRGLPML